MNPADAFAATLVLTLFAVLLGFSVITGTGLHGWLGVDPITSTLAALFVIVAVLVWTVAVAVWVVGVA